MAMLQLDAHDEVLSLRVQGEIDWSNGAELRDGLRLLPEGGAVVVDLTSVPFMDSAGLGALICGIREFRERGGAAAICVQDGQVSRLLAMAGFDRLVPTAPSWPDAREAILASAAAL